MSKSIKILLTITFFVATLIGLNNKIQSKEIRMRILENKWEFSPNKIRINKGEEWTLKIYNEDSFPHSFFISELDINKEILPKTETTVIVESDEAGIYNFFCSTICGGGHYRMNGQIEIK